MAETPWYQQGPASGERPRASEPKKATAIGPAGEEPVGIYLGSAAMDALESELAQDPTRTGLLVGHPLVGVKRPFILVTGIILSPDTPEGEDDVRFKPGTLEQLYTVWRKLHPGTSVVGWFHGRPHRGVAISGYERFTHHRFFSQKWQLALFIDTARSASRLYRWEGAELVPCDNFYFWNVQEEPVSNFHAGAIIPTLSRDEAAAATDTVASPRSKPVRFKLSWHWALLASLIYFLTPQAPGSIPWLQNTIVHREEDLTQLEESLNLLETQTAALQTLKEQTAGDSRNATVGTAAGNGRRPTSDTPPPTTSASPSNDARPRTSVSSIDVPVRPGSTSNAASTTSNRPVPDATTAAASEPRSGRPTANLTLPQDETPQDRSESEGYVIQPGDTMWRISATLLGDPRRFHRLAETNDIDDPDIIYPGQKLYVPPE